MKKVLILFFTLILATVFLANCSTNSESSDDILTDSRDGKTYKVVKIGEQIWMAENLNYIVGKSLCYGEDGKAFGSVGENGAVYYTLTNEEIQANCDEYGRLYDWETAIMACPQGYRLPTNADWDELLRYVDGNNGTSGSYESETAAIYLKAASGWVRRLGASWAYGSNGTDDYGFSALPGGYYFYYYDGNFKYDDTTRFDSIGYDGRWWSASEYEHNNANVDRAYYYSINLDSPRVSSISEYKDFGHSVRCLKDFP